MAHKKKKNFQPINQRTLTQNKRPTEQKFGNRKARIIVRNLPFANLSEDLVKQYFSQYGNVVHVNLLKKQDGKFVGCGFVEFDKTQSASKAIYHANGKELSGRAIVVDWALPKDTFIEKVKKLHDDSVTVVDSALQASDNEESIDEKKIKINDSDTDDNDDDKTGADDDDEDNDDDDDEECSEMDVKSDVGERLNRFEENKKRPSSDVEEGKTVFITNIPFSATNDDLKECVKSYGPILYALICIDKLTEHSKGSGFVKFQNEESAEKCIEDSQQIYLKDQPLRVTRAVERDKVAEVKKTNKRKVNDSRNLYLVKEGVVMAGSPAAVSVSAADMAKRLQIEQWKTQILRNLNMFVSKTRLVVHNLPETFTDKQLRDMAVKFSSPSSVVKEARVMYNKKSVGPKGEPISKQIGFVSFTTHEDALQFLRSANNNPKIFSEKKRPILSFSIENREILNIKQKRVEKSRIKLNVDTKNSAKMEKMNRKQRRFIRRKEAIIKKRQEAKMLKRSGNISSNSTIEKGEKTPRKREVIKLGKRKNQNLNSDGPSSKFSKAAPSEFAGFTTKPGEKMNIWSQRKIRQQAEAHKEIVKNRKKLKKKEKAKIDEKKKSKTKEQKIVRKGNKIDTDKFTKLISEYKSKIEKAESFKKWYE